MAPLACNTLVYLEKFEEVLTLKMVKCYISILNTPSTPVCICNVFFYVTGDKAGPLSQLFTGPRSSADGRKQQVFKPLCFLFLHLTL